MASYEIENTVSGLILGVYEGECASDAIAAMLADAGCDCTADPALVAREVDPGPECAMCGRKIRVVGGRAQCAPTQVGTYACIACIECVEVS